MKKMLFLIILVLTLQLVSAAEVCVIIDYGNEEGLDPDSKCIDIDEGTDGYELLEESGFNIDWSEYYNKTYLGFTYDYGHSPCKIKNIGEDVDGMGCKWNDQYDESYWNFNLVDNGKWGHMPVGYDGGDSCWNRDFSWAQDNIFVHYCVEDGDTIGLSFGKSGSVPDMFQINISKVYVDGEKEKRLDDGGGTIKDVLPGSEVEFKIEMENFYADNVDVDVTDISIEAIIEEIDDGEDIELELDEFDIEADKKETKTIKFDIPLEVEARDRLLTIEIKGEDDLGIKYRKEFTYDLEIEKEQHDLKFTRSELDKNLYKCGEAAVLDLSILNIGSKNEQVELSINNEDLNIIITEDFELSNDVYEDSSKYEKRFNLLIPNNIDASTYLLEIIAVYGAEREIASVDLVVNECEKSTPKTEESDKEKIDTQLNPSEDQKEEPEQQQVTPITSVVDTNTLSPILIALLVVLIIVIIALLTIFLMLRK